MTLSYVFNLPLSASIADLSPPLYVLTSNHSSYITILLINELTQLFLNYIFSFYNPIQFPTSSLFPHSPYLPHTPLPIYSSKWVRLPMRSQQNMTHYFEAEPRPSVYIYDGLQNSSLTLGTNPVLTARGSTDCPSQATVSYLKVLVWSYAGSPTVRPESVSSHYFSFDDVSAGITIIFFTPLLILLLLTVFDWYLKAQPSA